MSFFFEALDMVGSDVTESRSVSSFLRLETLEEIKSQDDVKDFLKWVHEEFQGNCIFFIKFSILQNRVKGP